MNKIIKSSGDSSVERLVHKPEACVQISSIRCKPRHMPWILWLGNWGGCLGLVD